MWHWAFFQKPAKQKEIGIDGHPRKGEFLPPISLPRRMFAGSKLSFHRPLLVGETYHYSSSINSISVRQGKSGNLAFIRVEHRIADKDGNSCLNENQDIVYREASTASQHLTAAASNGDRNHNWDWEERVVADPSCCSVIPLLHTTATSSTTTSHTRLKLSGIPDLLFMDRCLRH